VRGTLGVLLLAKKRGLLADFEQTLDQLQKTGMHIKPDILEALRRLA
jgi:predicted nucleic acid-binding protein